MKRRMLYAALAALLTAALWAACVAAEDPRPAGIPVWRFFHAASPEGLETAVITGSVTDCEAGPVPREVPEDEAESIRALALYGTVTDRESETTVTGGTWLYTFRTPEGEYLMTVEMYRGCLVGVDGMYGCTVRGDGDV